MCKCLDETGRVILHASLEQSFRILRISRFLHFFQICNIPLLSAQRLHAKCLKIFQPGAVRICVRVPGRSMLIRFTNQFGALRSEILQKSEKVVDSWGPQDSGTFFRIAIFYFYSKCYELACKVSWHFLQPALWGSVFECLDETGWVTLHASLEYLEVEYCKSEKSVRFLRNSSFWPSF